MAATAEALISAGVLTPAEAARLTARPMEPDFLACGFAHIGAWGQRPGAPQARADEERALAPSA
jgi:hypothetical protein